MKKSSAAPSSRRSVSFFPSVRVHPTLHVKNYTKQELEATWFTQSEFVTMRANVKDAVANMKSQSCIRGLECRTKQGSYMRFESRETSMNVVLMEQRRQQSLGIVDVQQLSRVYKQCTHVSVIMAHELAME